MQIIINGEKTIDRVSIVQEKKISVEGNQKRYGIIININDSNEAETLEQEFQNVSTLEVVRENDLGEEAKIDFSKYNVLCKIERKVTDSADILYVYMIEGTSTETTETESTEATEA